MAQVVRQILGGIGRASAAVVTAGASEALADEPVVKEVTRGTKAVATGGISEVDKPVPTPLSTPAPEPAVEPDDPEPLIAVSDVLRKRRRARGFRSTILSGFAGGGTGTGGGSGTGVGGGTRQTLGS